ncbi:MAG: aminopeptidase P N-terminal domain-containing protein [Deltaproteobacteria bacterium]|nr:aminopeptidase P N-terminal domain-containing protein [Deltaproteobacteria bacterium]
MNSSAEHFVSRRSLVARRHPNEVLLFFNHAEIPRTAYGINFPFRGNSHFLYLFGHLPPGTVGLIGPEGAELFLRETSREDEVWNGVGPTAEQTKADTGVERLHPVQALASRVAELTGGHKAPGTVPSVNPVTAAFQRSVLGSTPGLVGLNRELAETLIELRLHHDAEAIRELRCATAVTVDAHKAAARMIEPGVRTWEVLAALRSEVTRAGCAEAYLPIVTPNGEVLHPSMCEEVCREGDLLLIDYGAESPGGFAGDMTRTYPVGRISTEKREAYELVLRVQREAIASVRPGVRYRDLHLQAARSFAAGFVDLGILRGDPDSLVERGAHALFFPHGLGHLLGLDVHDLREFGDLAWYAPGRERSTQFGLSFLRFDRDLEPNMTVTIEPGFYYIPRLLNDPTFAAPFEDVLCRPRLAQFADLHGIRIEDDVLVVDGGCEVLTSAMPKELDLL